MLTSHSKEAARTLPPLNLSLDEYNDRLAHFGYECDYTQQCVEFLVSLYECCGKTDKAQEWQLKLIQPEAVQEYLLLFALLSSLRSFAD